MIFSVATMVGAVSLLISVGRLDSDDELVMREHRYAVKYCDTADSLFTISL